MSETFLVLRTIQRYVIKDMHKSSCKVSVILVTFHENLSSDNRVSPCGQTDMTKLTAAFRNFANAPKKISRSPQCHNEVQTWRYRSRQKKPQHQT
jgi:hypothetical protein